MNLKRTMNKRVVTMHQGKPHIRTEIVILTPIEEEDVVKFQTLILHDKMQDTIDQMHIKVEDTVAESFEADIESINVILKHCY